MLMLHLHGPMGGLGGPGMSVQHLAHLTGLSIPTVRNAARRMVALGLLTSPGKNGKTELFSLGPEGEEMVQALGRELAVSEGADFSETRR